MIALGLVLFAGWFGYLIYFYQTHPLKSRVAILENQITISEKNIPQKLFIDLPRTSEDIFGQPMEPINIMVVASREELDKSFKAAGWFLTDPLTLKDIWRLGWAAVFNLSYPNAPGTPSFWDTQPNNFALEQPAEGTVRERHHIHFWQTPFVLADGRQIWFGTAHFDKSIKLKSTSFFPTHLIEPAVDKERDKIKEDLQKTGQVEKIQDFQIVEPTLGQNQSGDQFFTDGKAEIIFLKK